MPRVSYAFFTLAAFCGVIGTIWGSHMGQTGDHTTYIAHAHFNLIGWLGMAMIGGFYALAAGHYPVWLAWTNFVLQSIGAVFLSVAMIMLFGTGNSNGVVMVIVGSFASILSMVVFLAAVLLSWHHTAKAGS